MSMSWSLRRFTKPGSTATSKTEDWPPQQARGSGTPWGTVNPTNPNPCHFRLGREGLDNIVMTMNCNLNAYVSTAWVTLWKASIVRRFHGAGWNHQLACGTFKHWPIRASAQRHGHGDDRHDRRRDHGLVLRDLLHSISHLSDEWPALCRCRLGPPSSPPAYTTAPTHGGGLHHRARPVFDHRRTRRRRRHGNDAVHAHRPRSFVIDLILSLRISGVPGRLYASTFG